MSITQEKRCDHRKKYSNGAGGDRKTEVKRQCNAERAGEQARQRGAHTAQQPMKTGVDNKQAVNGTRQRNS